MTSRACKCCPIGHCVPASIMSTKWTEVIEVTLKVLWQDDCTSEVWTFITENVSLPPSPCLSQLIAFSYGPSKLTTLVSSPIQLPAGSQWGTSKWVGDYPFPWCVAVCWTADGRCPHQVLKRRLMLPGINRFIFGHSCDMAVVVLLILVNIRLISHQQMRCSL